MNIANIIFICYMISLFYGANIRLVTAFINPYPLSFQSIRASNHFKSDQYDIQSLSKISQLYSTKSSNFLQANNAQVFVCTNKFCREKGSDATMAAFTFLSPEVKYIN